MIVKHGIHRHMYYRWCSWHEKLPGLFYAKMLGNCVHCTFIITFFLALPHQFRMDMRVMAVKRILHTPLRSRTEALSSDVICHAQDTSSTWSIHGTLIGTNAPGQSGPGSNGNEGVLYIPQSPGLEPHNCCQTMYTSSIWPQSGLGKGSSTSSKSKRLYCIFRFNFHFCGGIFSLFLYVVACSHK